MSDYIKGKGPFGGNPVDPSRCRESVSGPLAWKAHQCRNPAKFGNYCGIHSAEAKAKRAARQAENDRKNDAKWEAIALTGKKAANHDNLVSVLVAIADGHNDPRNLAIDALDRLPQ
jgi:hypothetical protein